MSNNGRVAIVTDESVSMTAATMHPSASFLNTWAGRRFRSNETTRGLDDQQPERVARPVGVPADVRPRAGRGARSQSSVPLESGSRMSSGGSSGS